VLTVDPRDYEGRLDPALADAVPADLRVVRARAWSPGASRKFGIGDLGIRAFGGLRREAYRLLADERFDAVFVTIYPTYTALLGPLIKRRFGLPFVLDYQDPWVGEWGRSVGPRNGRPDLRSRASRAAAGWLEPLALRAADAVTAVSRATYEQAIDRTKANPHACAELPIGWDRRDLEFVHRVPSRVRRDDFVHMSYVGTLLPAGIETLRSVLAAVARLRAVDPRADRLRLHFFGTSNQRTDAPARVLPIAAEHGLGDIVTEVAPRLDYFDALRVLRDSTAVLLLGSDERHYTPSKVFPALMAERPIVAVLHEASTASDLLRQVGGPPAIRLIGYDDETARARVHAIAEAIADLLADPGYGAQGINRTAFESTSACTLAHTLAGVLDDCVSCAA
jgi:glycosyltransferase involved in cell wall biosynthesis